MCEYCIDFAIAIVAYLLSHANAYYSILHYSILPTCASVKFHTYCNIIWLSFFQVDIDVLRAVNSFDR